MTWVAAGVATVSIGTGIYEHTQAKKALKNLQNQPLPQYTMAPEQQNYYNRVNQASQYGFSPQETAAFKQNVAQQQNTGYQQGIQQSGGNLAQALSAGFGAQNLQTQNQFAAQGAELQRQKLGMLGSAAGEVQGQQNLINQNQIQRRNTLEQAYGQAMQAGLGNISSGLQSGVGAFRTKASPYGNLGQYGDVGGGNYLNQNGITTGYAGMGGNPMTLDQFNAPY